MPSSDLPSSKATGKSELLRQPQINQPPWYYRSAITMLKPLYRLQVWRRSHQRDNYRQEVAQRFGKQYPPAPAAHFDNTTPLNDLADNDKTAGNDKNINTSASKTIWCHAVSLGETNTVAPLLDALMADGFSIWLTNTTQTGFARGASRFADDIVAGRLSHSYVPVDSPAVIETFLAHVQPIAALFVETELWANILAKLSEQHIPSILVNGRLSESSFKRYQKITSVSASMMQNLTLIIAQDEASAKRFRQLGAASSQIRVGGSLKWVINTPKITSGMDTDKANLKPDATTQSNILLDKERPIWVAASTHSGEERAAIALHKQLLSNPVMANSLLIIVPRHPERFDEVAALIESAALQMARRSTNETVSTQTQIYLADTMGELMQWYELADVALVGGSLVDIGGHNPVEPASVATPIIMGQYTQSCQNVVDKLAGVGALYQPNNSFYKAIVTNDDPLLEYNQAAQNQPLIAATNQGDTDPMVLIYLQLYSWLSHPEQACRAGQAGEQLTLEQRSALTKQLAMIKAVIESFTRVDQPKR